jgi:hypothetical protein
MQTAAVGGRWRVKPPTGPPDVVLNQWTVIILPSLFVNLAEKIKYTDPSFYVDD